MDLERSSVAPTGNELPFVDAGFCSRLAIEILDHGTAVVSDEKGNDLAAAGKPIVGLDRDAQRVPDPQVGMLMVLWRLPVVLSPIGNAVRRSFVAARLMLF